MTITDKQDLRPIRVQWIFRWIDRICFITGVLALGYVGFTLLEGRVYQANAERSLESQIQAHHSANVSLPDPAKQGDVLARLEVPRLGMSIAVLQGTNSRTLRLGAGHIEGTVFPGEPGNSGIAGHRDTFFRGLKGIRPNDKIQLQTPTGLFRYDVEWVKVVAPDDISVLKPSTESTLTLVTCFPFYFLGSAPNRFVVHARLHSDPSAGRQIIDISNSEQPIRSPAPVLSAAGKTKGGHE